MRARGRWAGWAGPGAVVLAMVAAVASVVVLTDPPGGSEPTVQVAIDRPPDTVAPEPLAPSGSEATSAIDDLEVPPVAATPQADPVLGAETGEPGEEPLAEASQAEVETLLRPGDIADTLLEPGSEGALPRIAPDGTAPRDVYARPFEGPADAPRVALIIDDMGYSENATLAAIQDLPPQVTLAFTPYARRLAYWLEQARAAGFEVLLTVPMEPVAYPRHDPGPRALLTMLEPDQNLAHLEWSLARGTGYVGVMNMMGGRFMAEEPHLRPVLQRLQERGLLFVDAKETLLSAAPRIAGEIALPMTMVSHRIDDNAARTAVDERLRALERLARDGGTAVGVGSSFPTTFERIIAWAEALDDRNVRLAPVSAVVSVPAGG